MMRRPSSVSKAWMIRNRCDQGLLDATKTHAIIAFHRRSPVTSDGHEAVLVRVGQLLRQGDTGARPRSVSRFRLRTAFFPLPIAAIASPQVPPKQQRPQNRSPRSESGTVAASLVIPSNPKGSNTQKGRCIASLAGSPHAATARHGAAPRGQGHLRLSRIPKCKQPAKRNSQTTSTKCQYQAAASNPMCFSCGEMPGPKPQIADKQENRADDHMKAVKSRRHKEGGPVILCRHRKRRRRTSRPSCRISSRYS